MYRLYGDVRVLSDSLDSMCQWIDFLERNNPDLVWRNRLGSNYGDWLEINADTPREVLATAYFAYSTQLLARICGVLGDAEAQARYDTLAEAIRTSFREHFVDEDFRISGDTQTVYLLALAFGLLPESAGPPLAAHLVRKLDESGGSLTTGFIGVGLLCPVLCDIGRPELAYQLLHRDSYPSWLYSIRQGATTIWERWDGYTDEHGFQSAKMNSFNHYALGSIGEWLYRYVAGIDQTRESVAFDQLRIEPVTGGSLSWVRASYQTPRGAVRSSWHREGTSFELDVTIPPTATARVTIPGASAADVRLDDQPLRATTLAEGISAGKDTVSFTLASGSYRVLSVMPAR